jgi:hypothetical protein
LSLLIYNTFAGCVIFGMRREKKSKKYVRESDLPNLNDVTIWKDFGPPYLSKNIWAEYI